jgi:hypothetical protein
LEKLMRQQQDLEDFQNKNRHLPHLPSHNMNNDDRQNNNNNRLTKGNNQPQQHPRLTSTARHRRMLEIELMKNLEQSDEAINELMHLWMYENDASMAHELEAMQDECSPGMRYEEGRLLQMIHKYPTWAEPRARLALLFFFQGRTRESYAAALDTLQLKPWHFEIYPLLVLLSLREQKFGQALAWGRRSLPPYRSNGPNKRRTAWIQIAVSLAKDRLAREEQESTTAATTTASMSIKNTNRVTKNRSQDTEKSGWFHRRLAKNNKKLEDENTPKKPNMDSLDPEENAWQ